MNLTGVLNADMATMLGWISQAWRWWLAELAGMVPQALRDRGTSRMANALVRADGLLIEADAADGPLQLAAPRPMIIRLRDDQCLFRVADVPRLSSGDLDQFLELEAPRLFPMLADDTLVAGQPLHAAPGEARQRAFVASLPRPTALALVEAATRQGVEPARVVIEQHVDGKTVTADFLPAMQRAGLVPKQGFARAGWWSLVALLVVLNLAIMAWRDIAEVNKLHQLVDAQRPGVAVAQRLIKMTSNNDRLVRGIVERRSRREPVAVLAAATAAIPDGAWVQRFTWDGATVRLAGYKQKDVNVQATLRNSSSFTQVRNNSADDIAEIPAGQPFDISATFRSATR